MYQTIMFRRHRQHGGIYSGSRRQRGGIYRAVEGNVAAKSVFEKAEKATRRNLTSPHSAHRGRYHSSWGHWSKCRPRSDLKSITPYINS